MSTAVDEVGADTTHWTWTALPTLVERQPFSTEKLRSSRWGLTNPTCHRFLGYGTYESVSRWPFSTRMGNVGIMRRSTSESARLSPLEPADEGDIGFWWRPCNGTDGRYVMDSLANICRTVQVLLIGQNAGSPHLACP